MGNTFKLGKLVNGFTVLDNGNVGIGTTNPSYLLSFGGDVATTVGMNQSTLGTAPALTLKAADSTTGTNNEGGAVYINAGLGTGSGATSNIIFSTGAPLSSGTTRQTLTERMRINADGITKFIFAPDRGVRMKGATSSYSEIAGYQVFTENIRELRLTGSTLQFYTGDGSNSTGSERARITEAGNLLVGTTSQSGMSSNGLKVRNNFWQLYAEKTHTSNANYLNVNFNGYTGSAIVKVTHATYKAGVNTYSCVITYYLNYNGVTLSVDTVNASGAGSTTVLGTSTAGGGSVTFYFVYMGGSNNWSNAAIEVQAVSNNISEQVVSVTLL